jgi:hypothetical protein
VRGILTVSIPRRDKARVFNAQDWMHASGSAMRHRIDEPQAGKINKVTKPEQSHSRPCDVDTIDVKPVRRG